MTDSLIADKIKKAADDYAFQVPFDGTKDLYNLKELKAFEAGANFVLNELREQKPDEEKITPAENNVLEILSHHLQPYIYGKEACIDGLYDAASAIEEHYAEKLRDSSNISQNQFPWTEKLIQDFASWYRFSSSRTTMDQFKEDWLKENPQPKREEQPEAQYQIDFGNHLSCKIKVEGNKVEVEAAIDGWGNIIPLTEITITKKEESKPEELKSENT